jgi:SAM-dependent methyltransferase
MSVAGTVQRLLGRGDQRVPPLSIARVTSHSEFVNYANEIGQEIHRRTAYERRLIEASRRSFVVEGMCYPCSARRRFRVNYVHARDPAVPNWREHLRCARCGMNNRQRAACQIFDQECSPQPDQRIYLTEHRTRVFRHLRRKFRFATGSEYLDDREWLQRIRSIGVRHEDLTSLSFPDASFDAVLSFEVLEHVPEFPKAIAEVFRVLRSGGTFLFSTPFDPGSPTTAVRARVDPDGSITHVLEPEYHGDPLAGAGILCFQHFGWDLLQRLRDTGFSDAQALFYWSDLLGSVPIKSCSSPGSPDSDADPGSMGLLLLRLPRQIAQGQPKFPSIAGIGECLRRNERHGYSKAQLRHVCRALL